MSKTPAPVLQLSDAEWTVMDAVWALDGDKVKRMAVQIVSRRSGAVSIAGDLAEGDEVVVEGVLRLRNGVTVEKVGDNEAGPPAEDEAPGVSGRPAAEAGAAAAAERGS